MPRRYRSRRSRRRIIRRRRFRGRKRGRKTMAKIISRRMSPFIVPDVAFVKLKYQTQVAFAAAGSVPQLHAFALNGMYDPDLTFTGHQPRGFDQYAAFYTKYEVRASRISMLIINNSTVAAKLAILPVSSSASVPSDVDGMMEQPYCKWKLVNGNASQNVSRLTHFSTTKKITSRNIDSVNYTASFTANPAITHSWNILCEALDGVSTTDVQVIFVVTYYARCYARKVLGQS